MGKFFFLFLTAAYFVAVYRVTKLTEVSLCLTQIPAPTPTIIYQLIINELIKKLLNLN